MLLTLWVCSPGWPQTSSWWSSLPSLLNAGISSALSLLPPPQTSLHSLSLLLPFSFSTPFPSPNKTPHVSSVCMACLSLTSLGPPCLHSAKFPLALYHNSPLSHGWAQQHTLSFLGGNGGDYWATGGGGGSAGGSQVLCCAQGIWYSAGLQS